MLTAFLKRISLFILTIIFLYTIPENSFAQQKSNKTQATNSLMISYQGRLMDSGGNPISNGSHTLTFKLYDQKTNGNVLWKEQQTLTTSNGIVTAQLGTNTSLSGLAFDQTYYLGITVDGGSELAPRPQLTTSPYAMRAHMVDDSALTVNKLDQSGATSGQVLKWDGSQWAPGTDETSSGSANAWSLSGNSGTSPGTDFLGTTDNKALVFKVNGQRAVEILPRDTTASLNMGNLANNITSGVEGAIINGGGSQDSINYVGLRGSWSVIAGGLGNSIDTRKAVIGGGSNNDIEGDANGSIISGGRNNFIRTLSKSATISGGNSNKISSVGSTISGGIKNNIPGAYSAIPGGAHNFAGGNYSFAAGRNAWAMADNNFIWSSSSTQRKTTAPNQFIVYSEHVGINTNKPQTTMNVKVSGKGQATDTPLSNGVVFDTESGTNALGLQAGPANPGSDVNFISFYDTTGTSVGAIEGNGSGGVTYKTTGADFAEMLPKASLRETFNAGELVGVRNGKISKSTANADQLLVVTGKAGVLGNAVSQKGSVERQVAVSFVGQVPVKVRGPVESGDLIVASGRNDGTAKAVTPESWNLGQDGPVAGRAWGSATGSGVHEVNVAVGLDRLGGVANQVNKQHKKIQHLQNEVDQLKKQVQKLITQGKE